MEPPAPPVPAPANKTELLVSLRHLLRGLSAVFWGLPLALLACIPSEITIILRPLNILPAVIVTGLLLLGVFEMSRFRPQERAWQHSLDRARVFALLNFGLSPFIYFCSRMPNELYYRQMIWVMGVWAFYLVLLVLQKRHAQSGRRFAWGTLGSFLFVLLTFWGVYLLSPLHQTSNAAS